MVDMGRRIVDCVKVLQQKMLGIICPLRYSPYLENDEDRFQ